MGNEGAGGEGAGGELVPMTRRQFDFMHKKCVGALHDARQALGTRQRGGQMGERGIQRLLITHCVVLRASARGKR